MIQFTDVKLTSHGADRMKERNNLKGKQAQEQAQRAYEKGKNIEDFSKETQKYLNNFLQGSSGDCLKVWSNRIYLFGNGLLITSFPFPKQLEKKEYRQKQKRSR